MKADVTRRDLLATVAKAAAITAVASAQSPQSAPLHAGAGVDRVTVLNGRTYLRGKAPSAAAQTMWTKASGPGDVKFANPRELVTTATFTAPGEYTLKLTAGDGQAQTSSTLNVLVEPPP